MTDVSAGKMLELYRGICLIRRFELAIEGLFPKGEIGGTFHSSAGQEAVAVGVAAAARADDIFVSNHRGHGHLLAKGCEPGALAAELFGKAAGVCGGRGGTQHTALYARGFYGSNGITGGGIPVATGVALAQKLMGTGRVVFCFLGDGAANQGTFHESLNMASIWELPVVYVCEANQYALSMPTGRAMKVERIAERAVAYRMASTTVDGNDVLAVMRAAREAAAGARKGAPHLLECVTYRMRGHSKSDQCHYRTREEEARWAERDPLCVAARTLTEDLGVPREDVVRVEKEAASEVAEAIEFARSAPEPAPSGAAAGVFAEAREAPRASRPAPLAPTGSRAAGGEVYYRDALRRALVEEMERDERVFLLGEDIGAYGGVFKVTEGLLERFGPDRVIDTPISENSFVGVGVGSALSGMRPVVEIMFMDFLMLALDQLGNHAAKFHYIYNGQASVPLVVRTAAGGYRGYGATHSQTLDSLVMAIPGLKVVAPSTPRDAYGMLKTALRDGNPVVFIEHKLLYGVRGPTPSGEELVPFGRALVVRPGADVTIAAHSYQVILALKAAEALAAEGIDAEVVDLRSLVPLDVETLAESASRTGRAVLVEEGPPTCGVTAEVAARLGERAFGYLEAPILRVAAADCPVPSAMSLERAVLPSVGRIVDAARRAVSGGF